MPNDASSGHNTWTLGVLVRAGEPGAALPLSVTLRAWCTSAPSTGSLRDRIAELEATIAQHVAEHARTAERVAALEQERAAALHDAKMAREVAQELREACVRI